MEMYGKYVLLEQLASSEVSEIYFGRLQQGGGPDAGLIIKRLQPAMAGDKAYTDAFHKAAAVWAELDHPDVPGIDDFGKVGNTHFLAHAYIPGKTLKNLSRRQTIKRRLLPYAATLNIARRVAETLSHAEARVVHGCLNPNDVIVGLDGKLGIINFGMGAYYAQLAQRGSGLPKEKEKFLAPEVLQGKTPDLRADIYSLGSILYELLVGKHVTDDSQKGEITPPSKARASIPVEFDKIVLKMLANNPDDRPASAAEVVLVLRSLEEKEGAEAFNEKKLAALMSQTFPNEVVIEGERQALAASGGATDAAHAKSGKKGAAAGAFADKAQGSASVSRTDNPPEVSAPQSGAGGSSNKVWIAGGAVLAAAAVVGLVFMLGGEGDKKDSEGPAAVASAAGSSGQDKPGTPAADNEVRVAAAGLKDEQKSAPTPAEPPSGDDQAADSEDDSDSDDPNDKTEKAKERRAAAAARRARAAQEARRARVAREHRPQPSRSNAVSSSTERRSDIPADRRSDTPTKVAAATTSMDDDAYSRGKAGGKSTDTDENAAGKAAHAIPSWTKQAPTPDPVKPTLPDHGFLAIHTDVPVEVDIDGYKTTVLGKKVNIKLTPGPHKVKVTFKQSGKSFAKTINVTPGKTQLMRLVHGQ